MKIVKIYFSLTISLISSLKSDETPRFSSEFYKYLDKFQFFLSKKIPKIDEAARLKFINSYKRVLTFNDNPINRDIFIKAQKDIRITNENLLPIFTLSNKNDKNKNVYAQVSSRGIICIYKEKFDNLAYGAKRIIALHEAFHHKFCDARVHEFLQDKFAALGFTATCLESCIFWYLIYNKIHNSNLRKIGYIATPFISLLIPAYLVGKGNQFLRGKFQKYMEFRADQEAIKASKCVTCIEEFQPIWKFTGYTTQSEIENYIKLFSNQYCEYHQSLKNQP